MNVEIEHKTNIINKKNLLIAGPCSAESEEQLITTAQHLAQTKSVDVLRAGIWKPRTKPGGFEGQGTKALAWLLKAKELTGLKTATEVATAKHVEDAISFDVDVIWIGARTTVNPFSVQEIADRLRGTNQTVLIKNPINPDIKLWVGAIERIQKAGIKNVGLIHRGFSSYGNSEYRNTPMWHIPIEMKRLFPELPMICDPSHICGNRNLLQSISQKSIDLDFSGLIIESHIKPDEALTDKEQQISPEELKRLINHLDQKSSISYESSFTNKLDNLRNQINYLDEELLSLISNRMKVAKEIGELKKEAKITVLQTNRYNEILMRAIKKGEELGLSSDFTKTYIEAIHVESIKVQNQLTV